MLLLAVDRFGIKPLYFGAGAADLVFGSELICLLESRFLPKEVDYAALAEFFALGYVPPPATIFCGARKLEPGTFAQWTPEKGLNRRPQRGRDHGCHRRGTHLRPARCTLRRDDAAPAGLQPQCAPRPVVLLRRRNMMTWGRS
jgi:asparagine synthetase B (glutamine-hydrolysing)